MQEENVQQDNAASATESTTTEGTVTQTVTEDKSDPLDKLSDIEEVRREAKKHRSIAHRKDHPKAGDKPSYEQETTVETTTPNSQFITKEDFYRANEKRAERMFREQHPDLAENFDDIRLLYMARRGKETPEDILEDFYDGAVIYQARNPKKKEDTGKQAVRDLTAQPVVKSGGEAKEPKKAQKEPDPRFKPKSTPDSWYPKKEE